MNTPYVAALALVAAIIAMMGYALYLATLVEQPTPPGGDQALADYNVIAEASCIARLRWYAPRQEDEVA